MFDEFCEWYLTKKQMDLPPPYQIGGPNAGGARKKKKKKGFKGAEDDDPGLEASKKFDKIEKEVEKMVVDSTKMEDLWSRLDFNANGIASLAEIDKFVISIPHFDILNHKPALMRAYKYTISDAGGGDGDDWVEPQEFSALLRNSVFYNRLFYVFDLVDTGDDRRVDIDEFKASLHKLGLNLSPKAAEEEFRLIDKNGGGQVMFDEFCEWYLRKKNSDLPPPYSLKRSKYDQ